MREMSPTRSGLHNKGEGDVQGCLGWFEHQSGIKSIGQERSKK
jgi:hypothetical protein